MFVVYNVELSDWCAWDLIHPLLSFLYCVTSILTNFLTSPCISHLSLYSMATRVWLRFKEDCVAPWRILSLFFWTPWLGCLGSHIMSFLFLTPWSYHYSWDLKISFLSLNLLTSPGNQAQWLWSSTDCSASQVLLSVVVIKNVTFPLLFNYQFYLVLDDNRGIVIAKQRIQPLPLSVYFVLDSNQGIIIVKSYRLCGSLNGVVGCCNTYSNMTVQGVPKKALSECCWSHSALAQSPFASNPYVWRSIFWSFLTKTRQDQALPSHVNGKI